MMRVFASAWKAAIVMIWFVGIFTPACALAQDNPPQFTPADFSALRGQADAAAAGWKAKATLFRADLWGIYSGSRFCSSGSRFLYFVPGDPGALEVRLENGQVSTFDYPLDAANPPRPIPASVLPCDDAMSRLWDLAPTVSSNQVILQLLWPGVEKPVAVDGEHDATSYPLASLLKQFSIPFHDDESQAPTDRAVWRMVATRDRDVPMDQAYGAFIYIDAVTGEPLSKREPALGVQIYRGEKLTPASPITAFVFPKDGDVPADSPAEQVGTFDALLVGQKAQSMDLGLRLMVRDGHSDQEILAAIDQMCAWGDRMEQVRREDAAGGVAALADAVQRDPKNYPLGIALFKRYVDEIERERKAVLASPQVIGVGGRDPLWLLNEFELNDLGPGNPDQTLVKLNTATAGWQYHNSGTDRAILTSAYFRPARTLYRALKAAGVEDASMERQLTRLHWLISGNQLALDLAIGKPDPSLDPTDAFQLMIYAEMSRLEGVSQLENAEALRRPKISFQQADRTRSDGVAETVRTTTVTPPTADELADAQRMENVAKQEDAPKVAQIEDLALKVDANDPHVYYLWARIEALYYDKQLADRIINRGLMIDPGCAELHAARVIAWADVQKVDYAETYVTTKLSRPYTAADLAAGAALAKYDPWAAYFMSLQRLRLQPQNVMAHAALMDVLQTFDKLKINEEETVPDAREQHQREAAVVALLIEHYLGHPDQWADAVPKGMEPTAENLKKLESGILSLRGQDLQNLDRADEARNCFQKALSLDPSNQTAAQAMQ